MTEFLTPSPPKSPAKLRARRELPVAEVRRYLEPGPVVLVSSRCKGKTDVMTLGWHTVMAFTPSLVGCVIARANHSFGLIDGSGECVINLPEAKLIDTVADVGNCSGADIDKFAKFKLTALPAQQVAAPLIEECFAHFECRVADRRLVGRYDFFVLEVVRAQVATTPKQPTTLHYTGDGIFMVSGKTVSRRAHFMADKL